MSKRSLAQFSRILSVLACKFIRVYQLLVRPYLGAHCRFVPSCSEYGCSVFQSLPFWQAFKLTYQRLLRCHPWHAGGLDFPPSKLDLDQL